MSFELIGLGKLLNAMYATKADRISMLRSDIRDERKKASGYSSSKGGDFYGPFWADAKNHISGEVDLRASTASRISSNGRRDRLYTMLRDGFLLWWEENRRQRNEAFTTIDDHIKSRYEAKGLGTIKVENTLSFTIGEDGHRVVYPYFCEDPSLSEEAARLGLWAMSQSITTYELKDMRILDVIKGRTFSNIDTPLIGNEEVIFLHRYSAILSERQALKGSYD
ncbi:hypothetical protein [Caulobacter sp. S45]|uniref:hypothetical protein n=1 Tax=Caulobacter sp. S45 TaxID=1641861 RepID=UPI00131C0289|nr:hypothetical protein [Caulobacter sp. S45]